MIDLSIVMSYYNRREQLELTLRTIRRQYTDDIEIIVVDDGSDDDGTALPIARHFDMNIKVVTLTKQEKTWINPCVPYNVGFRHATGRLVMIQNPECLHVGNVIDWARKWTTPERYVTFSCYSSDCHEFDRLRSLLLQYQSDDRLEPSILQIVRSDLNVLMRPGTNNELWFNHPTIRPVKYHFCSCITRENLLDLGGFDERYAEGYCWDDNEFLHRIQKKGLGAIVVGPEHGFVVHQYHHKGPLRGACPQWHANRWLFENVTTKSNCYRVGCLS